MTSFGLVDDGFTLWGRAWREGRLPEWRLLRRALAALPPRNQAHFLSLQEPHA